MLVSISVFKLMTSAATGIVEKRVICWPSDDGVFTGADKQSFKCIVGRVLLWSLLLPRIHAIRGGRSRI